MRCELGIRHAIRHHGLWVAAQRAPLKILREARRRFYLATDAALVRTDYGVRMVPTWGDPSFEMFYRAEFGWFLANLLRRRQKHFVFLDVGANQGLYSLIASENRYCTKVVALEPVQSTADILRRNIVANRASTKITAVQAGLSDQDGRAEISFSDADSGKSSLHHNLDGGRLEHIDLITARTLGRYLDGSNDPIVVKVDVEGHEATVLEQIATAEWRERVDCIFYEMDEAWSSPSAIESTLRSAGFNTLQKIGRSSTHYDVLASR